MSDNPLLDLEEVKDAPISPATGISALALNFAMKYCDINTVQDGALYQQYKLEGKNMRALHLDMVFEAAKKFEAWILDAPTRLSQIVMDGIAETLLEDLSEGDASGIAGRQAGDVEQGSTEGKSPVRDSADAEPKVPNE